MLIEGLLLPCSNQKLVYSDVRLHIKQSLTGIIMSGVDYHTAVFHFYLMIIKNVLFVWRLLQLQENTAYYCSSV